jgi:hypothetical protein
MLASSADTRLPVPGHDGMSMARRLLMALLRRSRARRTRLDETPKRKLESQLTQAMRLLKSWEGGWRHGNRRNNPMQLPIHQSPRCGARTRGGGPCQSPPMPSGRCRMHGGKSPGAPKGNRNAWNHGHYSAEPVTMRGAIRELLRSARGCMLPIMGLLGSNLSPQTLRKKPIGPLRSDSPARQLMIH